jgi:general nucleoside transport system ATP-binding protein
MIDEIIRETCSVEVNNLTVRFGSFTALNDVSLTLTGGSVHAIVGQNGAGKTTMVRALMGLVEPSHGTILLNGRNLALHSVKAAKAAGIEMVHQAFSLPPSATVAEAIEFFHPTRPSWQPFSQAQIVGDVRQRLASVGVAVDPAARISSLPVETLQSLEIGRALLSRPSVLILDEPTAVLAPQESEALFARIRSIAASGVTVLLVLHKVREVLAVADTITVLRGGTCVAASVPSSSFDERQLSQAIIGQGLPANSQRSLRTETDVIKSRLLRIESVTTHSTPGDAALEDVTLDVYDNEIVGVAGVEGNGQRSLVEAIVGLNKVRSGAVTLLGQDLTKASVTARRQRGLRVVPFERLSQGVSSSRSLWENVVAGELAIRSTRFAFVSPRKLRDTAKAALDAWQVKYQNVDQPAGALSGGNIQRLILSRELAHGVRVLVAAHPTRGLDLGATAFVHDTITKLSSNAAVLLVSADLDELFALSDRIVVMLGGRITGTFVPPFDRSEIGAAMVGAALVSAAATAELGPAAGPALGTQS